MIVALVWAIEKDMPDGVQALMNPRVFPVFPKMHDAEKLEVKLGGRLSQRSDCRTTRGQDANPNQVCFNQHIQHQTL